MLCKVPKTVTTAIMYNLVLAFNLFTSILLSAGNSTHIMLGEILSQCLSSVPVKADKELVYHLWAT